MIDLEVTQERLLKKDDTLVPVPVKKATGCKYQDAERYWQGIPSIAVSPSGRIWIAFYTGGPDEGKDNFILAKYSDDKAASWSEYLTVDPSGEVRAFDSCLWYDPAGRLWLFWAQSLGGFDGRAGVWASCCEDSEKAAETWTLPVRIGDGVMLNKPVVCSNGEWLYPVALWNRFPSAFNPSVKNALSNIYVSNDHGTTYKYRGGVSIPGRYYDETIILEKNDHRLWMLVRCEDGIGEAYSDDYGKTWNNIRKKALKGPNSRFQVRRLKSGNLIMVNHQPEDGGYRPDPNQEFFYIRSRLAAYISNDDGSTWSDGLMLDERDGISYPDLDQDTEGNIYIVYDRNRYSDKEILVAALKENKEGCLTALHLKQIVDKPKEIDGANKERT